MPAAVRNHYRQGADFERVVMAALHRDGYRTIRAAGSHGKADIVALKPAQVVLVQCKLSGPSAVRPPEWNELWELATYVGALAVIASRPAPGRIGYHRLTGRKDQPSRIPPVSVWTPDRLIEGLEQC